MTEKQEVSTTLDERIREALSAPDRAKAENLDALMQEVKQELHRVVTELRSAEQVRIDPVATPSAVSDASTFIEATGLSEKRLTAALDRLDQMRAILIKKAADQAYQKAYQAAELERDELAYLLRTKYPAIVGELVQLLSAISANDTRIKQFSGLRSVEFVVRGAHHGFYQGANGMVAVGTLAEMVRLPNLSGSNEAAGRSAWPPASYHCRV